MMRIDDYQSYVNKLNMHHRKANTAIAAFQRLAGHLIFRKHPDWYKIDSFTPFVFITCKL